MNHVIPQESNIGNREENHREDVFAPYLHGSTTHKMSLCGLGFFLDLLWAQAFGLIAAPLMQELGFSSMS